MQVIYERCAGLDVHKKTVVACVLTPAGQETRTFATMTADLLALADWLLACDCTHVAISKRATTSFTLVGTSADFTLLTPHRPSLADGASAPWQGTVIEGGQCLL